VALPLLAFVVLGFLAAGYLVYGRFVARRLRLDPSVATPAVARADGEDFVPTPRFYLLGQHFSAIAAAGPILGPIAACLSYGWLPCVLWIALGAVLVGAVHDFVALVASVRHGARSVAELAREHLGRRAWISFVAFVWVALVYVIVAFTDVTAETLLGRADEVRAAGARGGGGSVALAAVLYLALALVMGFARRMLRAPLWLLTVVFVPATFLAIAWATDHPGVFGSVSFGTWRVAILAYCVLASLLPLWSLLQPRGYLGGFVLYVALAAGVLGMAFGGYEVRQPAFRGFVDEKGLPLFPFLFVTIACGACSGFHGLVCGGTTSRQVASEAHCRPVGYGAMLLEAFVALVALATVLVLSSTGGKAPGVVYGEGIARFLTDGLGLEGRAADVARTFGLMAFSTFVFDTLDVATRLGRYLLQELFGRRGTGPALLATLATAGVPLLVLLSAPEGSWKRFWLVFGASNQLLAALTLLAVTAWLRRTGRPAGFTLWPGIFLLATTAWALARIAWDGLADLPRGGAVAATNGAVAVLLLALAGTFVWEARRAVAGAGRPVAG
jgi:carbon starvation protein